MNDIYPKPGDTIADHRTPNDKRVLTTKDFFIPAHHSILFTPSMVKAILMGHKTVTRRMIKHRHMYKVHNVMGSTDEEIRNIKNAPLRIPEGEEEETMRLLLDHCPYGKKDHYLWVRETWAPSLFGDKENGYIEIIRYPADGAELGFKHVKDYDRWNNRPNIHMPKAYCRLWLKVVSVRVEKLWDITDEEAIAEGVETLGLYPGYDMSSRSKFGGLWGLINGYESWEANPWVWVIEFEPITETPRWWAAAISQ